MRMIRRAEADLMLLGSPANTVSEPTQKAEIDRRKDFICPVHENSLGTRWPEPTPK